MCNSEKEVTDMTCLGCKYARLCIMYEPRMKACKDYEKKICNTNDIKQVLHNGKNNDTF